MGLRRQRVADRLTERPVVGRYVARVERAHLTVLADEVLAEVPVRRVAALGEEGIDRRLAWTGLRLALGEEREGDAVVALAERLDLLRRPRLLTAELVAREAEDREALARQLVVQLLESAVLWREAALAGDVDHQRDLAAIVAQIGGAAVEPLRLQIVESHGARLASARLSRQAPLVSAAPRARTCAARRCI